MLLCALALLNLTARSATDALDRYILADMKTRHIPAVVFGVFKDGKILETGAYGLVNIEQHVPATIDSVFEIGSVTKQFTATIILERKIKGPKRAKKKFMNKPEIESDRQKNRPETGLSQAVWNAQDPAKSQEC